MRCESAAIWASGEPVSPGKRAACAAAARAASLFEASRGRSAGSERILSTSSGFGGDGSDEAAFVVERER